MYFVLYVSWQRLGLEVIFSWNKVTFIYWNQLTVIYTSNQPKSLFPFDENETWGKDLGDFGS